MVTPRYVGRNLSWGIYDKGDEMRESGRLAAKNHLNDECYAFEYVERHIWSTGPVCPNCEGMDRIGKLRGRSTRVGVYKCYSCRKPFSVKAGTIFEGSHVPLHIWLRAITLVLSSNHSISVKALHEMLGVTRRTASLMLHQIRRIASGDAGNVVGTGHYDGLDQIMTRVAMRREQWFFGAESDQESPP